MPEDWDVLGRLPQDFPSPKKRARKDPAVRDSVIQSLEDKYAESSAPRVGYGQYAESSAPRFGSSLFGPTPFPNSDPDLSLDPSPL